MVSVSTHNYVSLSMRLLI